MTREDAKREMLFAKRNVMENSFIDQAYDVAIKALSDPERKKGEWSKPFNVGTYKYQCSECKKFSRAMYDFCPNCGADMRGDSDN